ncbi:hypothetical protein FYK61_21590 [Xanthomonas citri]|uniref:hypothetical protein n=1 Tax=Xanthomonas citri TaxID=346 RepID=UPI00188552A3|nr:hypothetical protein [Xanthomonas citri]QOY23712.1 hypothetical protein FYK61_21590 [Xanthomonas citri]QQK69877.1 hypothetical protein G3566_21495 [Xanthomonas citri]
MSVITPHGGAAVTNKDIAYGSWHLEANDFIYKVERVQFLSSSDPTFSNELGQQIQKAQLKKKSVYKSHILDFDGNTSRTMTVDPMYQEAAVESSCTRITIKLSRRRFVERINSDIWA